MTSVKLVVRLSIELDEQVADEVKRAYEKLEQEGNFDLEDQGVVEEKWASIPYELIEQINRRSDLSFKLEIIQKDELLGSDDLYPLLVNE